MTNPLLNPEYLSNIFPDAVSDPNVPETSGIDIHEDRYKQLRLTYETQEGVSELTGTEIDPSTAEAIQEAMGGNELAQPEFNDYLANPDNIEFASKVMESYRNTKNMLEATGSVFSMPALDSPEFRNVNWEILDKALKVYWADKLDAEIVFAPINRELDSSGSNWKKLFKNLAAWDEENNAESKYRMKKDSIYGGLVVDDISAKWEQMKDDFGPMWQVSIMPSDPDLNITLANYNGVQIPNNCFIDTFRFNLADEIGTEEVFTDEGIINPRAETYLTLQAINRFLDLEPMDTHKCTWLRSATDVDRKAMFAFWDPIARVLIIAINEIDIIDDRMISRPGVNG